MFIASGPLFIASVGHQMVLAMLGMLFMHDIIYIVHVLLFTSSMLVAMIVKFIATMDVFVTVQPVSMMKVLFISR